MIDKIFLQLVNEAEELELKISRLNIAEQIDAYLSLSKELSKKYEKIGRRAALLHYAV